MHSILISVMLQSHDKLRLMLTDTLEMIFYISAILPNISPKSAVYASYLF